MTKSINTAGITALALSLSALAQTSNAFVVPSGRTQTHVGRLNGNSKGKVPFTTHLNMAEDSVEELRAAAAKMREEANRLAKV